MPTALSKAEQQRTKRAWEKSGYNDTHAAEILGIGRPGFRHRRKMMGLERPVTISESTQHLDARVAQRHADEMRALRTEIRSLQRELNQAEGYREHVFKLARQSITPPAWILNAGKTKSGDAQIPVLMFSDFHLGEFISSAELDGINAFDQRIAEQRYRAMIEKTIALATDHMGRRAPTYPGMVYLRLGDLISGSLHDLNDTNDLKAIPAVKRLVEMEQWGLTRLQEAFGKIWTITLPGNHGRDTVKPLSKEAASRSFDTLSGYMLEVAFPGKDFAFWTPESGDAVFSLFGHTFLATHGDKIGTKGGKGFVGPAAPIARGAKLLSDYYSALGTNIEYILMGHYHTRFDLGNVFANGCLCGYNQYAKEFRPRPVAPEQWLLFVDRKHGVTARWAMQFTSRPAIGIDAPFAKIN